MSVKSKNAHFHAKFVSKSFARSAMIVCTRKERDRSTSVSKWTCILNSSSLSTTRRRVNKVTTIKYILMRALTWIVPQTFKVQLVVVDSEHKARTPPNTLKIETLKATISLHLIRAVLSLKETKVLSRVKLGRTWSSKVRPSKWFLPLIKSPIIPGSRLTLLLSLTKVLTIRTLDHPHLRPKEAAMDQLCRNLLVSFLRRRAAMCITKIILLEEAQVALHLLTTIQH